MKTVYRAIENAARSKAAVFISGEDRYRQGALRPSDPSPRPARGSAVHRPQLRGHSQGSMESEVFGHAKGAYTGATRTRAGAAKLAHGGTLFLDEICEMAPALQAKLLRFLQSRGFRPLGSDRTESVDVRLICATNRDPIEEIAAGRLREDLYYRVHVVPVHCRRCASAARTSCPSPGIFSPPSPGRRAPASNPSQPSRIPARGPRLARQRAPASKRRAQRAGAAPGPPSDGGHAVEPARRPLPGTALVNGNGTGQAISATGAVRPLEPSKERSSRPRSPAAAATRRSRQSARNQPLDDLPQAQRLGPGGTSLTRDG